MSQNATHKKAMIAALEKCMGIVITAAKRAKIDRKTHYRWLQQDPEYKKAVDNISELVLDMAESQLHKQIKANNVTATIFFLKTKGKKRGYIEKVETGFTNAEGKDVLPQIVLQPAPNCEPIKES
jgi:hypothetical protein